jgi:predicted nucleotidyltransferase
MDFDRVLALLRALEQEGVKYVLVGGVAVNLHGIARNTDDIDLFVSSRRSRCQSTNSEPWRKRSARSGCRHVIRA